MRHLRGGSMLIVDEIVKEVYNKMPKRRLRMNDWIQRERFLSKLAYTNDTTLMVALELYFIKVFWSFIYCPSTSSRGLNFH